MHPNYEKALRCRGAVLYEEGAHLFVPGKVLELVVHPEGGGGWLGSGFFGISVAEITKILETAPVSSEPEKIFRLRRDPSGGPGEYYLRPFFSALREESREGLVEAAFWLQPKVRPARAFWQGRTIVAEYRDKLGLVIGKGGSNIRRFQPALARHGLRIVVRLTAEAEAEKRHRDAAFEAEVVRQRAEAEARRPTEEAAEAARAKEDKLQLLLRKKELLERKLQEQEGSGREEKILEFLLKAEEELAALKGGE